MYFNRKNAEQKNWRMIKKGKHFLFGCSLVFAVGASLATQVVHANMAEETTVESGSKAKEAKSGYGGEVGTYEAPAVAEIKPEVATTPAVAAKLGGETAKEVKALDKTKLEKYIVEIEAKLANGTYERKTEESVAVLKADLEAAKATLENATTQDEITKAYNKLVTTANTKLKNKPVKKKETPAVDTTNGQPTVGKKAENTEKKSESNSIENTGSNDPRNGKALDKNNAFRAEIAYNIDSTGNDYGKKDSVITSGIRGSSEAGNAITAVNSVMKYRARYNADATGKITSVDWQVFFNDHLQNFANDYGVKNEVFRNYIQIPNEVNMPTDIRRLQYRAEMKFVDRKYQLVGGDGTGLSDTVSFDNPTPDTAAGRALAKNENLKINGNWDNYTRGLDTLYNNTSFYYKDAVKDEISDTKNLVNSNALQGNRVIYDNANTGGNYRDGYVWEFTTTVPDTVTNEQLKNMKVSMGMLSTGTAGVDHGFHRIAENPVNLSKADVTPPTVKTQTVKVDEQPKAENSIANFKELPAGTKAEFKTPVDTATPGEKTATAVVTYPDTSTKEVPVKVIVEKEAVAPAKPVITTSLAGKANTKTPVEVKAEAGSTVSLFAHDGTKLGSAVANDQGVASITPTVDIPAGIVAATAIKNGKTSEVSDPVEATPAADAATNNPVAPTAPTTPAVAPTVEIPYSDKATKEVYVYGGEENSFDIKFKDDSGKIASAIVNGGGNQPFNPVAGEANTINTQYGFKANVISAETPATADAPAVITYRGIPAATDGLSQDKLDAATKGENPKGMALGWRYATATDTDGAKIENGAVGSSNATDPGSFRVMLKPQTQKYDITIPAETEKVVVANPAAVTDAEFAKVKEKLKIEFSKTNNDANLAKDQGKNVEDKDAKIKTIEKVGNDLVVTYKDGSVDKKSLTEFVRTNEKPTVEIQYSDPAPNKKEVYVYASEVNSFDIKIKDDSGKLASAELRRGSNQEFKDVAGETNKQDTQYGFTANKFTSETTATAENPAVITYTGTPAPEGAFTKEKFEKAIQDGGTPLGWRFVKAIDKDGEDARGNGRDATDPTAVNVILKPQTQKYDIKTPAEADKVVVSDVNNVTDKEFEKIKEKVKLEYSQNNPDARLADKKGTEVENPADRIASITKDGNDVVVTYKDGSKDKKPLSEFVTKKPTDADKNEPTAKTQTVNKGTTPKAEDSIGNVKDLPKGTTVAFKAPVDTTTPGEKDATVVVTYPDGSTEEVPVKVTVKDPSSTPDTEAPAKPNAGNDVVKPADKTVVANPEKLTDAEKKAIEDKVKAVNPGATVVVDDKGNATVTTPLGNTAVIPAEDLTKTSEDAANARKVAKELPNTGTADSTVAMVAAAASALLGLGLAGRRRKEDEEA
ncbi:MAG: Rib/alpha-like domain-containing protein [Streptococcus mitis]|nr:Rib/alpha-like domain-containing protein [Streptococcus mitis]